jgi:hypothetical protein
MRQVTRTLFGTTRRIDSDANLTLGSDADTALASANRYVVFVGAAR